MPMTLHNLSPNPGARKRSQRIGRGLAGRGAKSGRGMKGQRARSGGKGGLKIKGLKQTLIRVPKTRGFKSLTPKPAMVTLAAIQGVALRTVTPQALLKAGLVRTTLHGVKILGTGRIDRALTVKGCRMTRGAAEKIKSSGGTI